MEIKSEFEHNGKIYEDGAVGRQVRSFCIVEPYGDFESDPDGDITEIKLIDPQDYKKYFDWKVIGDRIMERAMEIKQNHSPLKENDVK
jgi:hypothetical protein